MNGKLYFYFETCVEFFEIFYLACLVHHEIFRRVSMDNHTV